MSIRIRVEISPLTPQAPEQDFVYENKISVREILRDLELSANGLIAVVSNRIVSESYILEEDATITFIRTFSGG